ncbi:MAG: tetratricopeptide repeat protein, partial [Woeseiaceae bacterium]|nr:tetratricopeptide repeat protein [Woeseiaceae bacterium]
VTCSDCHDPHTAKLVTGPDPNAVCAQCHSPAVFAAESHMGHVPDAAGCVDCHMPARTYMVVDDRRDHSFRVPRPDIAEETGSPLSCANCHADQSPAWAKAAIAKYAGDARDPGFAAALAAASVGHANPALVDVVSNSAFPGIARAAAIEALAPPFSEQDIETLVRALADPDPLVRVGALASLRGFAPAEKARFAGPLLTDPVKSVRIDAALAFADTVDLLDAGGRRAFDEAAAEFRRSRLLTASQTDSLLSLAAFEARLGKREAARAAFERALYIEPGWSVIRTNFADFLREEGEDDRGEEILREGLELNPDDAILHHTLGLLLVRTGRSSDALESLEAAARLDVDNARFSYVLGVALNSLGRSDDAASTLASAYEKYPGNFEVAWAYATITRDRGELAVAREIVATMRTRFPGNPDVEALVRQLSAEP